MAFATASASSCSIISWHFFPTASFTGGIRGESSIDRDQSRLSSLLGERLGENTNDCGLSKVRSSDSDTLSVSSSDVTDDRLPIAESRLLTVDDAASWLSWDSMPLFSWLLTEAVLSLGTANMWRWRTLRCAGLSFTTSFLMWLEADVEDEAREAQNVSTATASLLTLLCEQFTACIANFKADISRVKLSW